MKFLIDAQLPRRLTYHLRAAGYDAVHTLDLPNANRTTDMEIIAIAAQEGRVVVTKDADFVNSFVVSQQPEKLLLISTGNITNADLEALLIPHLTSIASAFETHDFIEVTRTALIIHM
jgi:predicted nuclease of predicted toxin-antitoxin system